MEREEDKGLHPDMTLGARIERLREDEFVGRSFELRFFTDYLTRLPERNERILSVYGTGGMGKTVLLERFRAIAAGRGALYVQVDLRQVRRGPEQIAALTFAQLPPDTGATLGGSGAGVRDGASTGGEATLEPAYAEDTASDAALANRFAARLNRLAASRRMVLAFDHYEEIGSLDDWLRETVLPKLHANMLVVIAGRFSLEGPWRLPPWRKLAVALSVSEWSYDEAMDYLARCGVTEEAACDRLWLRTLGHPLSLAMATATYLDNRAGYGSLYPPAALPDRLDTQVEELVRHWLQEAQDDELRELVMAASIARTFQQESLILLIGRDVPSSLFDRLVRLSFVERGAGGWRMHELVRETVRHSFRERFPERFRQYVRSAVRSLRGRIAAGLRQGRDISEEAAELLGQIGNPILRAHFRHSRASRNYWETIGPHNAADAETYIRRRIDSARDSVVRCSDPETGKLFRFSLSAVQSLLPLHHIDVRELIRLGDGRALRLLRCPRGETVGLAAAVPIRSSTLPYLKQAPLSRAYFAAVSATANDALHDGGFFLYATDVIDYENEELRSDIVRLKLSQMMSGTVLLASPPHVPYFAEAYRSLGFAPVPGAEHADYDAATLTPTYRLDTRGAAMLAFLDRVCDYPDLISGDRSDEDESAAFAAAAGDDTKAHWTGERARSDTGFGTTVGGSAAVSLTPREQEVADLLTEGHTNAEIAAELYMSVAAVKKHVNSMLHKHGLRNRTQLAKALTAARPLRKPPD
ncbi:LuxR family transcriptional regulator [Paenibacillus ginsengarvi]|uniref:Helix-turn-helix transcriptional regulator n=1 Tax=Paenibacillus ginsengarvi TaxID=400777 RepID=A0A3B0CFD8_9BACL|nr:LuxR family transcriptional regulator [Paenibacillus ginsengarvi]RKN84000.1 helix-turn-helix transcriptional regulator [Paenibacillus ginsengarvi]